MTNQTQQLNQATCYTKFTIDVIKAWNGDLLTGAYAINFVFLVVSNVALIIGLIKTKQNTLKRTSKLFLLLSSSDLLLGLILMPIQIASIHLIPDLDCMTIANRAFWSNFPLILSGLTILLISVDRYLMITRTSFYHKYFTRKVMIVIVFIEICISFSWSFSYMEISRSNNLRSHAKYLFSVAGFEAFILTSVVIVYIALLQYVQATVKVMSSARHIPPDYDRKLLKTIMLISITLVICYAPSVISITLAGYFSLFSTDITVQRIVNVAVIWSLVITSVNSGLNACICIARSSQIKKFYRSIFCRKEVAEISIGPGTLRRDYRENMNIYDLRRSSATGMPIKMTILNSDSEF